MNYLQRIENVTVLGSAGKMGSGILLLTAIEMADQSLLPENKEKKFLLYAMDVSQEGLNGLMRYLKTQILKLAEKKTVMLRKLYSDRADLIENEEIINQYVFDVMCLIRPVTTLESAYESDLIFEAVSENPDVKVKLLSTIKENNKKDPWFFTNTSSIPIKELDEKAKLDGKILGFHFYNPPAVQRLVELIVPETTKPEVAEFAKTYAKNLRKKIVPSNDFAGFIGNGHFMRDALHGISEVERLSSDYSFAQAVYMVNKVSQEFLIRPMGIFQLIDYVGIDVCQYIMQVMNQRFTDENIHSPLLDKLIEMGIKGGQYSDGSQKDGFLKYEKGRPVAVLDVDKNVYQPIEEFKEETDNKLGGMPGSVIPWKVLLGKSNKDDFLKTYFTELLGMKTLGSGLAIQYALRSRNISLKLVSDGVANSNEDVNTVLLTGFFHAYGPINDYLNWEEIK